MKTFSDHRRRSLTVLLLFVTCVCLVLFSSSHARAGEAEFRYQYVSLNDKAPPGFTFYPGGINDSGRVYGNISDATGTINRIAFYENGALSVLRTTGFGGPVNGRGTVGSTLITDSVNFIFQAALFHGNETELIPPQPGETFGFVIALNDSGTALVESDSATGKTTHVLYERGHAAPIEFGLTFTPAFFSSKSINNNGVIAGTTGNLFGGARGFRFDTHSGELTMLEPVQPDLDSWGLAINNRGDVLGYSFVEQAPYHERIGIWDRAGHFETYCYETISTNRLMFNDNNLIVITLGPSDDSYLVPRPGVRMNLADLVENLPFGEHLRYVFDMNNHGDLIGFGDQHSFLLKRIGDGKH